MKVAQGVLALALGSNLAGVGFPTTALAQDSKEAPQEIRTFYLAHSTGHTDLNDAQTALRNLLPKPKIFAAPSENAIVIRGTAEDLQLAEKLLADLDLPKKLYRLTYTITETENGKRIGTQHCAVTAVVGLKTDLKQGSKVPIVTGTFDQGSTTTMANSQVQYLDVGLEIKATLNGDRDGIKLESEIVQSSVAEEHSGVGPQDPVIRQTTLEGSSILEPGKPLILGSLDITGSTRHQDIEVVAELVK
jgi:type II secretory pathway component GspD/PulD (secretin)